MTENKARQPKGIPTGGQFAAAAHAEPDVTISASTTYATAADVMETRSEHSELIYVHYDDRLTTEQMDSILAGDWAAAEDSVFEAYEEHLESRAGEEARELVDAAYESGTFHCEYDELDFEEQQEAINAIREKDTSDPVRQLLRTTPDQLMRTRLGTPVDRLTDPSAARGSRLDDGGHQARAEAILGLLKDHGADPEAEGVREAVDELVNEGPYDWHEGVRLELIFTGNVEDVAAAPSDGGEEVQRRQLTFTTPEVLLIDTMNGSGHEVNVPATLIKVLDQPAEDGSGISDDGRVMLDSHAPGYSWDDVAGVVHSAYKPWAPSSEWLIGGPQEP